MEPSETREEAQIIAPLEQVVLLPPQRERRCLRRDRMVELIDQETLVRAALQQGGQDFDAAGCRVLQRRVIVRRGLAVRAQCRSLTGRLGRMTADGRAVACPECVMDQPGGGHAAGRALAQPA